MRKILLDQALANRYINRAWPEAGRGRPRPPTRRDEMLCTDIINQIGFVL